MELGKVEEPQPAELEFNVGGRLRRIRETYGMYMRTKKTAAPGRRSVYNGAAVGEIGDEGSLPARGTGLEMTDTP